MTSFIVLNDMSSIESGAFLKFIIFFQLGEYVVRERPAAPEEGEQDDLGAQEQAG